MAHSKFAVSHALREWGKPRQLLMGGTPFGGTASPRPRCIAVSHALREWFEVTVRQARLNQ
ncbi:MAG: hypothetical protein F6K26_38175 [Moorea sp. SIO2I5]|nr:hypothetical protein [Moorena sp. SIO2I5]